MSVLLIIGHAFVAGFILRGWLDRKWRAERERDIYSAKQDTAPEKSVDA